MGFPLVSFVVSDPNLPSVWRRFEGCSKMIAVRLGDRVALWKEKIGIHDRHRAPTCNDALRLAAENGAVAEDKREQYWFGPLLKSAHPGIVASLANEPHSTTSGVSVHLLINILARAVLINYYGSDAVAFEVARNVFL